MFRQPNSCFLYISRLQPIVYETVFPSIKVIVCFDGSDSSIFSVLKYILSSVEVIVAVDVVNVGYPGTGLFCIVRELFSVGNCVGSRWRSIGVVFVSLRLVETVKWDAYSTALAYGAARSVEVM